MNEEEKLKLIEGQIRELMKKLNIEYMPTHTDTSILDVSLRNNIANTGGFRGWAKRLGLLTKAEHVKKFKKKTEKPSILSESDILRNIEKEKAEQRYFEQCKPGKEIKKKLPEAELAKYREKSDTNIYVPSMLNIDNLVRQDHETDRETIQAFNIKKKLQGGEEQMAKEKALSITNMELTGKVLSYKIQGDSFSISNKKTGINVDIKDIDTLIQELQELKGVVANG